LAYKIGAGIRHPHRSANLLLRLSRMIEEERCDECESANTEEHDGLFGDLPGFVYFSRQRAATTSVWDGAIGEPL
jgi:hypothetical protein